LLRTGTGLSGMADRSYNVLFWCGSDRPGTQFKARFQSSLRRSQNAVRGQVSGPIDKDGLMKSALCRSSTTQRAPKNPEHANCDPHDIDARRRISAVPAAVYDEAGTGQDVEPMVPTRLRIQPAKRQHDIGRQHHRSSHPADRFNREFHVLFPQPWRSGIDRARRHIRKLAHEPCTLDLIQYT
jgi:hypothetical protein